MSVKLRLCLWVQKNVPSIVLVALCVRGFKKIHLRWCRLLFVLVGSKKCTRDISEVTAVFMGSKKYTRNSVGYSLRLRVQKKYTRNGVGCYLSLWVQKNIPATMLVAF